MKKTLCFKKTLAVLLALFTLISSFMIMPASAASDDVVLDVSSGSKNLSIRLKLTDPFGLMAITSMSKNGQTIAFADYAAHGVGEVGFLFLDSETAVSADELLNHSNTVMASGKKYDDNRFCATYGGLRAAALDHTVYFAAYAVVNGTMILSDVRSITPSVLVEQGAQGAILGVPVTDETERTLYGAILAYFQAYREHEEKLQTQAMVLKVGTYNINFGQDNSVSGKPLNLQNVANVILENDLDIIALNEVHIYAADRKSAGRHTPYEIAKLATAGSQNGDTYYWAFAAGLEGYSTYGTVYSASNPGPTGWYTEGQGAGWDTVRQSGYGNAIISKYPIKSVREVKVMAPGQTEQLQDINGKTYERRTILIAELDVNGTTVTVIATHFDLYTTGMNAAVNAIKQEMQNITTPIILMGDLNCNTNDAPITNLKNAGFTFVGLDDNTATHANGGGRIDYIAYLNMTVTDTDYTVITSNKVSDHYPVVATLTGWKSTKN